MPVAISPQEIRLLNPKPMKVPNETKDRIKLKNETSISRKNSPTNHQSLDFEDSVMDSSAMVTLTQN